jgi:4-amino-4-deoxy-L-arabinose transferase-like glycosyltransferase
VKIKLPGNFLQARWLKKAIIFLLAFTVAGLYTYKVGDYAPGIFCDEAEIGLLAQRFIQGDTSFFHSPFFYQHFEYVYGSLPVITTAPFVYLFGLSDFGVRIGATFFGLVMIASWYYFLKQNHLPKIGAFLLALTPLFFHISHNGFGQAMSLFFLSTGYLCYLTAKVSESETKKFKTRRLSILAGLCIALSSYGYGIFQLAALILVGCIWLAEVSLVKKKWREYTTAISVTVATFVGYLPLLHQALTNPDFWVRFQQKTQEIEGIHISFLTRLTVGFWKYFSPDFLWFRGELAQPGAFVTRHGLTGIGLYPTFLLLIFLFVFFGWRWLNSTEKKLTLPLLFFWFLSAIGGIVSNNFLSAPYSFALIPQLLTVPLLASMGWLVMSRFWQAWHWNIGWLYILGASFLLVAFVNILNAHGKYQLSSADYWGWQYGPKEIVPYLENESANYDQVFMTGAFNEPKALFNFYRHNNVECLNCIVGGISDYSQELHQLFVLRKSELDTISTERTDIKAEIIRTFALPNGTVEYFAVIFKQV